MKYHLTEELSTPMTAASKAREDCVRILNYLGLEPINIPYFKGDKSGVLVRVVRQAVYIKAYLALLIKVKRGDTLVLQHPFKQNAWLRHFAVRTLYKRKVRIIRIIHDLDSLRQGFTALHLRRDDDELALYSSRIICHNTTMLEHLVSMGVRRDKLISLELFDYLTEHSPKSRGDKNEIIIAGNLDKTKSGYIYSLPASPLKFRLYGVNYSGAENAEYVGAYPADELPLYLSGGFGLVWDGDSPLTCSSDTGNYLKFNNPHKLSLYLACGLPVVVWSQSATANTVKKYGLGLCVDSLADLYDRISSITNEEYLQMVDNAEKLSAKLKTGEFMKEALIKALGE